MFAAFYRACLTFLVRFNDTQIDDFLDEFSKGLQLNTDASGQISMSINVLIVSGKK